MCHVFNYVSGCECFATSSGVAVALLPLGVTLSEDVIVILICCASHVAVPACILVRAMVQVYLIYPGQSSAGQE